MRFLAVVSFSMLATFAMGCAGADEAQDGDVADAENVGTSESELGVATATMRVTNGELYDRCGERIMLRGVNKDVVSVDREGRSIPEIAKTGANSVRMVWVQSVPLSQAERPVQLALQHGLVPIIEIHDATGNFAKLGPAVDFWLRADSLAFVKKYEKDLIVNIANEAGNHTVTDAQWVNDYNYSIRRMRTAGIKVPLVVDASSWGQNVEQLLRVGAQVVNADPQKNVLLSWHEYSIAANETTRITKSLQAAKAAKLPLIIGEFAGVSVDDCSKKLPYQHVMSEAQRLGIGWLAWSWDSTNGACRVGNQSPFDMTWDGISAGQIKPGWAYDTVATHWASIQKTSKRTYWQTKRACQ